MMISPLPSYKAPYCCVDHAQETHDRESSTNERTSSTTAQHAGICDNNPVLKRVLQELEDNQNAHGTVHPKVAETWNALGLIRVHAERNAVEARKCHECALAIFKELNLAMETSITLNDLGYCCERLNQRDMALRNYQDALRILESEKLPENHPRVISTRRAVTRILRDW
jgi:tetratricopeptide (TPR) repeat protein